MKALSLACVLLILFAGFALADLSVQVRDKTNGEPGKSPASFTLEVTNGDSEHKTMGFLLCEIPQGVTFSSTLGEGAGSAVAYSSPLLLLDSLETRQVVLSMASAERTSFETDCRVRYLPYKTVNGEKQYLKQDGSYTDKSNDEDYRSIQIEQSMRIGYPVSLQTVIWFGAVLTLLAIFWRRKVSR